MNLLNTLRFASPLQAEDDVSISLCKPQGTTDQSRAMRILVSGKISARSLRSCGVKFKSQSVRDFGVNTCASCALPRDGFCYLVVIFCSCIFLYLCAQTFPRKRDQARGSQGRAVLIRALAHIQQHFQANMWGFLNMGVPQKSSVYYYKLLLLDDCLDLFTTQSCVIDWRESLVAMISL